MDGFSTLLQQGNAWFFTPSAILLGVLHGLRPGRSKTMTVAFIIAIKGIIKQAVMLGLAATLLRTAVVWLIALGGIYISKVSTAQVAKPWPQFVSVITILGTTFWMFRRTWQGEQNWLAQTYHDHDHGYHHYHDYDDHHHDHDDDHHHHHRHHHHHHHHEYKHNHDHATLAGLIEGSKEYQDAHERVHVTDIQRRFAGKEVTNGQILLFGLTGGLIPRPAVITALLICIQFKALTLGATTVLRFSPGLALTSVTVGVETVASVQQAAGHWSGFNTVAHRAPHFPNVFIAMVGLCMGIHGYTGIVG